MMRFQFLTRVAPPQRKLMPAEAYDLLAEEYDRIPNPMIALERGVMGSLIPPLAGLTIADLGCGTGRYTARALESGARLVYAVDLSARMIEILSSRLGGERVRPVLADLQELPFHDCTLDAILCGLALGYAPRLDRAIFEMGRVLRPGGFALLSDLHPVAPSLGWDREYRLSANGSARRIVIQHHPYTFERLFDLFYEAGFSLEDLREVPVGGSVLPFAQGWRERRRIRKIRHVPAVAVFLLRKET